MGLEEYRYDALNCVRCSNCKWMDHVYMRSLRFSKICPSLSKYLFDAYSAQGRMDVVLGIIDDELRYTPKLLDVIYRCSLCGACDVMCKRCIDLEPLKVLEELRAKAYKEWSPLPQHRSLVANIKNYYNPWGQPRAKRERWAKDLEVKDITKEKADVLFYAGCTAYDPKLYKLPRFSIEILKRGGVDIGILGAKEKCCGSPAYRVGDREVSIELAKNNIKTFNQLGFSKVVTSCAGCYGMFKSEYPAWGKMNFQVLHIVEFIDQLIKENKLKFSKRIDLNVTYHDPCHLGRRSEPYVHWEGTRVEFGKLNPSKEFRRGTFGVYDSPREVLKSIPGVELIEMERIKENAWCCGSGGGVKVAFEDFALWTAEERIEEAESTRAEALVTCCPYCEQNFNDAIEKSKKSLKVYDLVEIVFQAI